MPTVIGVLSGLRVFLHQPTELRACRRLVAALDGDTDASVTPQTTHIITGLDCYDPELRALRARAAPGCEVLQEKWLQACGLQRAMVFPTKYRIRERQCFVGMCFFLHLPSDNPREADARMTTVMALKRAIISRGGLVTGVVGDEVTHLVTDASVYDDKCRYIKSLVPSVVIASLRWLERVLDDGKLQEINADQNFQVRERN